MDQRAQLTRRALMAGAGVLIPAGVGAAWWRETHARPNGRPRTVSPSSSSGSSNRNHTVEATGARSGPLHSPDILVFSQDTIPADRLNQVRRIKGVTATMPLSLANVSVQGQLLSLACADPERFRNFTPGPTADDDEVWDRVAGGEIAVDPQARESLRVTDAASVRLGAAVASPQVHIGAWAPQIAGAVQLFANPTYIPTLHMRADNALLLSTGENAPDAAVKALKKVLGASVSVQRLDVVAREGLDPDTVQTAYAVGSVADAVGHYVYTTQGDQVIPDPSWVREHIVTESVPILGPVTGNKLFFPQLNAAMNEIVDVGLAPEIHTSEYGGCYYARYIAGTHTLSNHAFGLAIDLNVAENQRGTVGQMNRTVVSIFNRWGFTWGGTWSYTDPMHFEINALVSTSRAS